MAGASQTGSPAGRPRAHTGRPVAAAGLRARFSKFIGSLGPGLITGASDDDPSGISTYSMAGASFGYALLWTALFSFPLMAAMQLMSARLGAVKGKGLGALVRECYPGWVLWGTCILLLIANLANASADLAGMADATQLATGTRAVIWTPIYTAVITALLFGTSYRSISNIFRWLALILFAYVITAFMAGFHWKAALLGTLIPHLEWSKDSLAMFVAILGTTISPYLFFWQTTQEVEEKLAAYTGVLRRTGSTGTRLRQARLDVGIGMFISNSIMYFIILTTAATLHAHGETQIQTARQAAEALRPLAGGSAYWIFTLGLIGTGMLGVPALIGSSTYAVSEAARWHGSLDKPPRRAWHFYAVLLASMAVALALNFAGIGAVRMLFWAAVLNGVLSPPVILLVVLLSSNRKLMGERASPPLLRYLGWITLAVMSAASIGLFIAL
ncbi:MAG TPA: divalent metal cation transporter [Terriglobia bacterium]|nr:divalent metal cation transporter [Terriglobia bacterium]